MAIVIVVGDMGCTSDGQPETLRPAPSGTPGCARNDWLRKSTLLSRGGGSPLYRALLTFKTQIQAAIAGIIPEPAASLLTGILLGVEPGIPERVKNAFSTSSSMHVVAVSGFNQR
jgi:hypothetical protein